MPEIYRHTQLGLAVIIPVDAAMLVSLYFVIRTGALPGILLLVFLGVLSMLFFGLTVIGTHDYLEVRFGIGLIKKRFELKGIVAVRPYRTSIWQGWGIHYSRDGLVYNISGFDAVHITMIDGRKYIIGTNDRDRLLHFIASGSGLAF
jgi:hypothetical protein